MKSRLLLATLLVASTLAAEAAYEKKLIHVLEQLRQCQGASPEGIVPMVGGPAVGLGGAPHEFYLLFPYVNRLASEEDLVAMLGDKSPVVRIMAAKCILNRKKTSIAVSKVDVLLKDTTQVCVAPFGCIMFVRTVGDVIGELKKNPEFLGDIKEPNQASEPTAPSGRGSP